MVQKSGTNQLILGGSPIFPQGFIHVEQVVQKNLPSRVAMEKILIFLGIPDFP